jgi:hypothetical protein
MRKAYYTLDLTEAVLLKDHLLHGGVVASVRNKGAVRIPHDGIAAEVWIADGADDDAVKRSIQAFLQKRKHAAGEPLSAWRCRHCGEESPGEFEFCWKCNEERPAAAGGGAR